MMSFPHAVLHMRTIHHVQVMTSPKRAGSGNIFADSVGQLGFLCSGPIAQLNPSPYSCIDRSKHSRRIHVKVRKISKKLPRDSSLSGSPLAKCFALLSPFYY